MEAIIQRIVELTPEEKTRLQTIILGYGRLKEAAIKAGLHFHTLRNVARIGYGEPKTVEKLRETLLKDVA